MKENIGAGSLAMRYGDIPMLINILFKVWPSNYFSKLTLLIDGKHCFPSQEWWTTGSDSRGPVNPWYDGVAGLNVDEHPLPNFWSRTLCTLANSCFQSASKQFLIELKSYVKVSIHSLCVAIWWYLLRTRVFELLNMKAPISTSETFTLSSSLPNFSCFRIYLNTSQYIHLRLFARHDEGK